MLKSKLIRLVLLLALLVPWLASSVLAADSKGNRKSNMLLIGKTAGIHPFYILNQPYRFELPGESWSFGLEYGSSTASILSKSFTLSNQGLYARWFPGNSFNILMGYFQRGIASDAWTTTNASLGTVTYKVDTKITDLGLAIGNQWIFDFGLTLGADWLMLGSGSLTRTDTVTSGTEDATSKAKASSKTKVSTSGVVVFTLGYSF